MEFHHPPKFSLNSGISGSSHGVSPFYRGLFFIGFGNFCWLGFPQVPPFYHQPIQTLALEKCPLSDASSHSRTDISPTVGEEGEDEEDEEEE